MGKRRDRRREHGTESRMGESDFKVLKGFTILDDYVESWKIS